MWAPSLNASSITIPAPGTSWCAVRHARRCSSDRKKLRVVQRVSHARRSASACRAAHTMASRAPGPGPEGSTSSAIGARQ